MTLIPGSRTFAAALCACALLLAALALPSVPASARSKGGAGDSDWQVLAPVTYRNLTIFPIRAADRPGSDAYITLDEGTRNGTVVISEKGGGQAAAVRVPPHGRVSAANRQAQRQTVNYRAGGATVNELALINRSGKKLLLLAGEVIVGGKQDRIVQEDRVIPPISVPVALNVFCVEHGRWSARGAGHGGGGTAPARQHAQEAEAAKFSSLGALAHPKLRGVAQDRKAQGDVWNEVRANNAKLGTANATDTYQEVYSSKRVGAQIEDYLRALERAVMRPGVVGVVVARGGRPVWADVFASQRIFAAYWPKLLKSYVVDALGDVAAGAPPTVEEVARYLREREGTISTTTQEGVYQLVKTEQPAYAVFELRDISLASPLRLHFNKMDR